MRLQNAICAAGRGVITTTRASTGVPTSTRNHCTVQTEVHCSVVDSPQVLFASCRTGYSVANRCGTAARLREHLLALQALQREHLTSRDSGGQASRYTGVGQKAASSDNLRNLSGRGVGAIPRSRVTLLRQQTLAKTRRPDQCWNSDFSFWSGKQKFLNVESRIHCPNQNYNPNMLFEMLI